MDRWVGKTAVVTGASAGIGACLVVKLAEAGVNVVGLARRPEKVDELTSQVKSGKGKITSLKCDVSKPEDITKAFNYVDETFGGVDIMINNAGVVRYGYITEAKPDDIKAILDTNVMGLILCTKEAVKSMEQRNFPGHIININSVAGHCVPQGLQLDAYVPSKWAVTAATETTRKELLTKNPENKIKIASISPGLIKTEIYEAAGVGNDVYNHHPYLNSEDVVDAVMYVLGTPPNVDITELIIRPVGETQ